MNLQMFTNSTEQRPLEKLGNPSYSQEIPRLLCNPKVYYHGTAENQLIWHGYKVRGIISLLDLNRAM